MKTVLLLLCAMSAFAGPLPDDVMDSPFGIVNPWPEVGAEGMGAVWCRCGGGSTQLGDWPRNEPMPGVFRWDSAESEWDGYYVKEKLAVAPILSYTPGWASCAMRGQGTPRSRPPRDLWDYYRFCRAISERFKGRIWFWEVWNEPNIGFFEGTVAEYADLVKAAAAGVQAGSPEAYVVFGGMAGVDRPFLDRCYQYGVRDFFDVMAAHPYQWGQVFDDRWYFEKLTNLCADMKRWDDLGKPVWLNEVGWSTGNSKISDDDQARLLVQSYVSSMARTDLGVQRIFWFCVKDWGGPNYGLFAENGAKKPGWHAYRAMVQRLTGMKSWGRVRVPEGVRAYAFTDVDRQRCMVVLWSKDLGTRGIELPVATVPLAAWDIKGDEIPVPAVSEGKLSIDATPAPVYLLWKTADIASLVDEIEPLAIDLPDPARRSPVWVSLYPQQGSSLPWLWRGRDTELRGRLFNASETPFDGSVTVTVTDSESGEEVGRRSVAVSAKPMTDATFTVALGCSEDAPSTLRLDVSAEGGVTAPPLRITALVGDGPVVNFLANSHLERSWYLEPDAESGCAESVRFGSEWVYQIPVPKDADATVSMDVGAHQAAHWTVAWSQDKKAWQPLLDGDSNRAWHSGQIEGLKRGALYLRCQGKNQQVGEVRVAYRLAG